MATAQLRIRSSVNKSNGRQNGRQTIQSEAETG